METGGNIHALTGMVGDKPALNFLRELFWALKRRLYMSRRTEQETVNRFHQLYYDSAHFGQGWSESRWLGTPLWKSPLDLWIYQEILQRTKPDLIVETGTYLGGSALFFASICDMLGHGCVVTIDIEDRPDRPVHPRITYLHGSSTDESILQQVRGRIEPRCRVMVVLDSDHSCAHVSRELALYAPLVCTDCYLIVEDTNINGHPVWPDFGPGPHEAVESFLSGTTAFVRDRQCERYLVSFNQGGYLKRVDKTVSRRA